MQSQSPISDVAAADERAARRCRRARGRAWASAARARRRPAPARSCGRCRCRRSGSRPTTPAFCIPSWHQATKSAMVSSSLSAGMTIDSSGLGDVVGRERAARPRGRRRRCGATVRGAGALTSAPLSGRGSSPASSGAAPRARCARSASRGRGCARCRGGRSARPPSSRGRRRCSRTSTRARGRPTHSTASSAISRDGDVVAGRDVVGGETAPSSVSCAVSTARTMSLTWT